MDTSQPLITIGITAYNATDTIQHAINSAVNQNWSNKEIIIVDDSSTDQTVKTIEGTIKNEKNITLYKQKLNKGVAAARNRIIDTAKGEFIAFFDDDDVSDPVRLSEQYKRIIEYEKTYNVTLIVCHTARIQQYPDGFQQHENTLGTAQGIAPNGKEVADRILFGKITNKNIIGSCATCSQMARSTTYKKLNKFDENLRRGEDTDFCIRLALAGGHFTGIKTPLVKQTMTAGNEKKVRDEYDNYFILFDKHQAYLKSTGWYGYNKTWMQAKFLYLNGNKIAFLSKIFTLFLKSPIKLIKRIYWSLPEKKSRKVLANWYQTEMGSNE